MSLLLTLKKIMQIKNIRHTGIVVDNLKKSLNFYKKLMGFKIKKRMIEKGIATDRLSRLKNTKVETVKMYIGKNKDQIELLDFQSHKRKNNQKNYNISKIGISHFALTVKNLDKTYSKLKKAGINFTCKPILSNDGNVKLTFCRAPEGTLIELVEELSKK